MTLPALTPLQRKAAFKAAVTLREITAATAARRLGVSYNHLMLVLAGDRQGSARLRGEVAGFLGRPEAEVFGLPMPSRGDVLMR
jgi:transcriptional regulator with XRE-family HTH domain